MAPVTETQTIQLVFTPDSGGFNVKGALEGIEVRQARLQLRYRHNGQRREGWKSWDGAEITPLSARPGGQEATLAFPADARGVRGLVRFWLPDDSPCMTWQAEVINSGTEPVWIDRIEMLQAGFLSLEEARSKTVQRGEIFIKGISPAFFSNGWGSWDDTRTYSWVQKFRRTRMGILTLPMRQNPGTLQPRRTGLFSSDMFGLLGDQEKKVGILVGFLSQREHFGSLEAYIAPGKNALSLWANGDGTRLDPGATMRTDRAYLAFVDLNDLDPLGSYFDAVAAEHGLVEGKGALTAQGVEWPRVGWCSWYHYFQGISEGIIRENVQASLAWKEQVPLELIQIDDGFQAQVGDWLEFKDTFPQGPAPLAQEIREKGMMPGLWLAPFTVDERSRLFREHPGWLLRDQRGRLATGGYNWGRLHRALDLTNPAALGYVKEVIRTAVEKWGFTYLKLDFLYSGAVAGVRQDPTLTRAQVMQRAFKLIRETAGPGTILLGCGCPLGAGIGFFDMMRIGPDVAPEWYARQLGVQWPFRNEPGLPSVRNAVQNILVRAPMHRRWWVNDGDCLLLRPETQLTLAEVRTLATALALTGGPLLVSDDLAALPLERLQIMRQLLPLPGPGKFDRVWVLDWFDQAEPQRLRLDMQGPAGPWYVLALVNWKDRSQAVLVDLEQFKLEPQKEYLARSFWTGEVFQGRNWQVTLPAHGCLLLAVREWTGDPVYLGGNLHFSQGLELAVWEKISPQSVRMELKGVGRTEGQVLVWLLGGDAPVLEVDGGEAWLVEGEKLSGATGEHGNVFGQGQIWKVGVRFEDDIRIGLVHRESEHGKHR